MKSIFIIIFLLCFNLNAEVEESYSQKEVLIGEEVILSLKEKDGEQIEWKIPEKGNVSNKDESLPYAIIKDVKINGNSAEVKIVFLESGEKKIPVKWKSSDKEFESSASITVKSSLSGETQALDIESPFVFSGPYILKLIILSISAFLVILVLGYFFLRKKPVPERIADALIQEAVLGSVKTYKEKIDELISSENISHKEFVFLLTGYIKETAGLKTGEDVQYMNMKELATYLKDNFGLSAEGAQRAENYFNLVKYMPNTESISSESAKSIFVEWQKVLNK